MIMKASAAAAAIGAAVAFSAPEASAWSLAPLKNRFNTALCAAADSPLFSDDLTSKTYHGPNPQNLKYKETMLRQAYDDWRAKYARGDYDKDRFRIFKLNFLASQKAHEIQTARAKMEGRPLPQLLELNAYGDCTKEEYLLLKDQENNNLIAPRTLKDANNTSATTNTTTAAATNVAATTTIKPTKSTESSQKKPYTIQVDDRGPEIERKATMFPQRSDEPSDDTTPLSPMTPKTPSVKIIQDQLDDLKKATENLAPQPGNQPPQFKSVGSNSQVSKPNSTFLKPDEKGVFPDRSVSFLQSFQKQTSPPKILPKPDQKTKRNIPVNPNPASSFVAPDQLGIFGDKSATTFPKRTAAHALPRAKATVTPANEPLAKGTSPVTTTPGPRASQTSDSSPTVSTPTTSVSQSNTSVPTTSTPALQVSKASASTPSSLTTPKVAPSDQEKRDVANIHPDSLHETPPATFPEPVATEKFNTPETTSSPNSTESAEAKDLNQTPATSTGEITETSTETVTKLEKMEMPKINPGSSYVKPDLRGSFTERSATIFPKRTNAYDAPNKPADLNAKLPTSVSYIKPDVFYREQSATTFPKRTEAHNARTIATEVDGPKNEASTSKTVTPTGEDTARPDAKSGHEAKPQTSPSASFIKPDVFFQERSVSTFPKRTEDHNTRRPVTRLETKASPSLSYIKPDFEYPERSVTTFTPRNDPNDALVKSSMFRDDPPAPHKTLLPDQRRANIADPFSFARKERQDLPPPDFKEPEPTQTEEIITQPGVSFAELTIVESPPTIIESPPAPPATPEDVELLDSTALAPTPPMTMIKKKAEKPEVQVSVPDMTSIQMKLGNAETKNSSQKSKIPSRNLTKAMVPSSESSASKTDRSMQPTKPKVAKNQNDSGSSQRSEAEQRMKKWKESQAKGSEASTKSSSDEKKSELLRRSLLKARVEMEQEANQINVEDHLKVEPPKSTQEVVISPADDVVQRPEAQIDIDMKSTGKQELETSATIATKHVHGKLDLVRINSVITSKTFVR